MLMNMKILSIDRRVVIVESPRGKITLSGEAMTHNPEGLSEYVIYKDLIKTEAGEIDDDFKAELLSFIEKEFLGKHLKLIIS